VRQDLFYIPHEIYGLPLFGAGWLLILWGLASAILLVWLWRRQGWSGETRSYLPLIIIIGAVIWQVMPRLEVATMVRPPVDIDVSENGPITSTEGQASTTQPLGLPIRGYGVMLLLGVISGVALAVREGRRGGLDPEAVYSLAFYLFIGGIVGARSFYIIEYWHQFQRPTLMATLGAMLNVTQGGLVVYGSLIGAAAVGIWHLRRQRLPVLAMADLLAPSMMLGLALGRIGCLLNGCCHGGICGSGDFGITFPQGSPPYRQQSELGQLHGFRLGVDPGGDAAIIETVEPNGPAAGSGLRAGARIRSMNGVAVDSYNAALAILATTPAELFIETDAGTSHIRLSEVPPRSRPVHPTQIYSSINAGLLFLLLWSYYPARRRDGEVFALLLSLYPIARILLEIIRTDEPGQLGTSLTISQIVSLVLLAIGFTLWVYLFRRPRGTVFPVAQ
jgi:phosphatidylglycerol:prolipoprotein diacylglycerol transferase